MTKVWSHRQFLFVYRKVYKIKQIYRAKNFRIVIKAWSPSIFVVYREVYKIQQIYRAENFRIVEIVIKVWSHRQSLLYTEKYIKFNKSTELKTLELWTRFDLIVNLCLNPEKCKKNHQIRPLLAVEKIWKILPAISEKTLNGRYKIVFSKKRNKQRIKA